MNEFTIYSIFPNKEEVDYDAWRYELDLNGKIIAKYGDWYHDKGDIKAKGFIQGYAYGKGWKKKKDYIIKYDNKIDESLNGN